MLIKEQLFNSLCRAEVSLPSSMSLISPSPKSSVVANQSHRWPPRASLL